MRRERARTFGRALGAVFAGCFAVHCDPRLDGLSGEDPPRNDAASSERGGVGPVDAPPSGTTSAPTGSGASPGGSADSPAPLPAYVARVIADAPIGYWRFEEATGSVAHDASGHGKDGTFGVDVVHGQPGLVGAGAAARLDGVQDPGVDHFIRVPESRDLEPASAVSIEGWVQVDGSTSVNLISYGADTQAPYEPYVLWLDKNTPSAYVVAGGSGVGVAAPEPIGTGTPHHLVAVYDGGALVLYVDGVSVVSTAAHGTLGGYDAVNGLGIGSGYSATRSNLDGVIDEVAIYDVALTPTQVAAHYAAAQR